MARARRRGARETPVPPTGGSQTLRSQVKLRQTFFCRNESTILKSVLQFKEAGEAEEDGQPRAGQSHLAAAGTRLGAEPRVAPVTAPGASLQVGGPAGAQHRALTGRLTLCTKVNLKWILDLNVKGCSYLQYVLPACAWPF